MKQHAPIKLNSAERVDLGSITKHPGMEVLLKKILAGHVQQQLEMIHDVQPDDPDRTSKLDGIGAVAFAMKLTEQLLLRELEENWKYLLQQESKAKGA